MGKIKSDILHVKGIDVGIYTEDYRNEYISLTDIARYRNSDDPRFAIQNWMRNRNTIEFLGLWESLHNPSFNRVQFDTFKTEAGLNRFIMTPSKWIEQTGAIGFTSKAGRYGGYHDETKPDWTLKFEILEVYPGASCDDTVIAELYFGGIDVH